MKLNNKRTSHTITKLSLAFLILFSISVILLGLANPVLDERGSILFLSAFFCTGMPLLFLSATWLAYINRIYFSNIFVWIIFQLFFILIMIGNYYAPLSISLLFTTFLFVLFPLLIIVNFIYSYSNYASLKFIGFGSIGFIWVILIGWLFYGNLIEKMVLALTISNSNHNDLWIMHALMTITACIVIGGIASFFTETIKIFLLEWQEKDHT